MRDWKEHEHQAELKSFQQINMERKKSNMSAIVNLLISIRGKHSRGCSASHRKPQRMTRRLPRSKLYLKLGGHGQMSCKIRWSAWSGGLFVHIYQRLQGGDELPPTLSEGTRILIENAAQKQSRRLNLNPMAFYFFIFFISHKTVITVPHITMASYTHFVIL